MEKIKLSIYGMHCASCANNVEKSLKKITGVKEISVSAITNKAIIEVESGTNKEELKKAVEKVGYKVVSIE